MAESFLVLEELRRPVRGAAQFNPLSEDSRSLAEKLAALLRSFAVVGGALAGLSWLEGGAGAAWASLSHHLKLLLGMYVASEYVVTRERPLVRGEVATAEVAEETPTPPDVASFVRGLTTQAVLPGNEGRMDVSVPDPVSASIAPRVVDYDPKTVAPSDLPAFPGDGEDDDDDVRPAGDL